MNAKAILIAAAVFSFGFAVLHLVIIAIGSRAYLYFGAAGMAQLAEQSSPLPTLVTLGITAVFALFGFYGLAGAGVVRAMPFVQAGVIVIGGLYTLRGLVVILDLVRLSRGAGYPLRQTAFSAVSLGVGIVYLAGALARRTRGLHGSQSFRDVANVVGTGGPPPRG